MSDPSQSQSEEPEAPERELKDAPLEEIAGGLNPCPEPPLKLQPGLPETMRRIIVNPTKR